jgi:16S rRNA (guanine527-N7)-methyltransferase
MAERAPLPSSARDLPPLPAEFWSTLDAGLAAADMELPPPARTAIDHHVRLLVAWNAAINLTGLRTPEQIARGHVLDSLIAVSALRRLKAGSVLDLGSGGGFPGLPIAALLPLRRVALVDSIRKKARFLEVAAAEVRSTLEAGLDRGPSKVPEILALAERAEDLAEEPDHREGWDLVVARAVGSVAEVAELGLPLVRRGGHVVAWKREGADSDLGHEVADARRIAQAAGGASPRIERLTAAEHVGLPGHCLVIIEKRGHTPDRYPRPAAERRRSP